MVKFQNKDLTSKVHPSKDSFQLSVIRLPRYVKYEIKSNLYPVTSNENSDPLQAINVFYCLISFPMS